MINNESIDFLFDTLSFYSKQYDSIADLCYEDVLRALTEIKEFYLPKNTQILPFGSYHIKSNYQLAEPMEFYVVLQGDREQIRQKEVQQKQALNKKRQKDTNSTIKGIYQNLLSGSSKQNPVNTAFDVAKIIMEQMQKYITGNDVVYFKDNVVFIKFSSNEGIEVLAKVLIVYDFDNNQIYEFKKYGISTKENSPMIIDNIFKKNNQTNGNYIVLCKLVKMLEMELVFANMSNKYLSKKSLFVESVLYNIPNELLQGTDYSKIFLNITNYLKLCDIEDILLPDNKSKMFSIFGYYANNEYQSFVKKILYLNKNTNKMLKDAMNNQYSKDNLSQNEIPENNTNVQKNTHKLGKRK